MHTTCSVEGFNGRRASGRGFHALAAPPPWLDTRPFLSTCLAPHCRGEKHQDARPSSTLSPLLPLPLHPDSRAHATVTVAAIATRARARGGYAASVHHCLSCAPLRVRAPPGEPLRTFPGQDRRRGHGRPRWLCCRPQAPVAPPPPSRSSKTGCTGGCVWAPWCRTGTLTAVDRPTAGWPAGVRPPALGRRR
jgi:hypothetical protein